MRTHRLAGLDEGLGPRFPLAPLIDMSFLMLVFFLVSATLQKQEADLRVVLPGTPRAGIPSTRVEPMHLRIEPDGTVWINQAPVRETDRRRLISALSDRLQRYAAVTGQSSEGPNVRVDCDDAVAEQRFIDVLAACVDAGIKRIELTE